MPSNPVTLLVMIILAAFVIDRVVAAVLFLLSFITAWDRRFPEPVTIENTDERRRARKKQKLIYFVFASILSFIFLLSFKQVGVLKALSFESKKDPAVATSIASTTGTTAPEVPEDGRSYGDFLLTWLILVGGAENIARLLKGSQGDFDKEKSEPQPIEITGKLTLEDRSERNG